MKQHLLALLDDAGQQVLNGLEEILAAFDGLLELGGDEVERLRNDRVEDRVRPGDRLRGTDRTELELVAGEGKRAGAVAIAGVARQLRQHRTPSLHEAALLGGLGRSLLQLIDDVLELIAEEDRDDGRRCLVGAEAMIVVRAADGDTEQLGILGDGANYGHAEDEELGVVVRRVAGVEQVFAGVGRHRPVVVLTRAVDAGERLLVEQAGQAVLVGGAADDFHRQHLVVGRQVAVFEDRGDFILGRGHFVVARLDRHAELEQLALRVGHAGQHALGDGAEVLVFQFLALGRRGAEKRAAGVEEIGPEVEEMSCRSGNIPVPGRRS